MVTVKPFKAIRPTKDKAPFVISRSNQSYAKKELNANLEFNLFSFLHIINPGRFTVGFNMLPIGTPELKQIADDGLVMPPKSTYIEPKLRSGIAIYEL